MFLYCKYVNLKIRDINITQETTDVSSSLIMVYVQLITVKFYLFYFIKKIPFQKATISTFNWSSRTENSAYMSLKCRVKSRKIGVYASVVCELNTDDVRLFLENQENFMSNAVFYKLIFLYASTCRK